jgi:hypothetical protein
MAPRGLKRPYSLPTSSTSALHSPPVAMHIKDWNCCLPNESPINAIVLSCILECNNNQGTEQKTSLFGGLENKSICCPFRIKKRKNETDLLKKADFSNSRILQLSGCQRYPSKEKSVRWVSLHAHISDNHCLHSNPEYKRRLLSATHLPLE